MRSITTLLLFLVGIALVVPASAANAPERPNVLLIYVDNVGYGDLGCYGNVDVKTPRIDQLAREGARCTDFYVVTTSCTPSRGAVLTGRYPGRNGLVHQLVSTENWTGIGLPHRERILPQYLKDAGYATGCFGKWNIGFAPGSRPTERGFDEFFGFRSGNIGYFGHLYNGEYDMMRGTEVHRVDGYATELFAEATNDFIQRHQGRPWFVYLPFNAAHFVSAQNVPPGVKPTWEVPAKYLERYGWNADEPDEKRRYRAVLTALDDAVGRVLDQLDTLRLRENTLVIFISDNGAFMLPQRGLEVASNAPLRDGGTTCYEGGTRVPALFRWPGRIKPGTIVKEMLSHLDVLPLALAVSGAKATPGRILDGLNPMPVLEAGAVTPHRGLAFAYANGAGWREGALKIVRSAANKPWELYDLATDVGERNDLANSRPADVARMSAAYAQWQVDLQHDASAPAPRPARTKK